MSNKYVRVIFTHWITVSGIILIAAGTFLVFIGLDIRNRSDDRQTSQSIKKKAYQVGGLIYEKKRLLARISEYQKNLSEKDKIIQQLKTRVDSLNMKVPRQPADQQTEAGHRFDSGKENSEIIARVKSLCIEGKSDEAYEIADGLRQKYPDFGLAYFMLGTIAMYREDYDKGEYLLNRAIQLGLPDADLAWAFHNLGVSALKKEDFEKAREFLEQAVGVNPGIEESRQALKLLADVIYE